MAVDPRLLLPEAAWDGSLALSTVRATSRASGRSRQAQAVRSGRCGTTYVFVFGENLEMLGRGRTKRLVVA